MRKKIIYVIGVTLALLIVSGSVSAHHGSSNYDMSKSVSVKGTVTQFEFINPHSSIRLEAKDDKGNVERWLIEADSPNNLGRAGWSRDSIKPGDQVTITLNPAKNGSPVGYLLKVVLADGKEFGTQEQR